MLRFTLLHSHYLQWPTWRHFDVVYFMINGVVHHQISANHAALPTCCFCSCSADTFFSHFISVAFVITMPAFKQAAYFYTNEQKNMSSPRSFPPAAAWLDWLWELRGRQTPRLKPAIVINCPCKAQCIHLMADSGGWLRWCECRHTGW